jgi:uncharacterized heparinase superfamily protein
VLLDLLPLRRCFRARSRTQSQQLDENVSLMLAMLRSLRLGDGLLARFNGVSVGIPARLATVMAYADAAMPMPAHANQSGYERLHQHNTILIADCGPPPPVVLSNAAHAGCLSFELSCGTEILQHVVVWLPDERKGEQLVLVTDEADADRAALLAHAQAEGFPELWVPRTVLVVAAIPVSGTDKVDLQATRTLVASMRPLL